MTACVPITGHSTVSAAAAALDQMVGSALAEILVESVVLQAWEPA
jgi:hypothetical protein